MKPTNEELLQALRGVLAWYQNLDQPGLVPNGLELSARLREALRLVARAEPSKWTKRDQQTGQYQESPPCDACGKPVGTDYFTDDEVCDGSDGPGFFLCSRAGCIEARDVSLAERRKLYASQRKANDARSAGAR